MDARRFIATDIGKIVNRFLTKYFTKYVEYGFTADMEDELDAVSRGEEPWITPLEKFWKPFIDQVEEIETNVSREEVAMSRDLGIHPESGRPVSVRMGRFGPFVQAGTKDDEEKPKFAGLRPGQKMDTITLADAHGAVPAAQEAGRDCRWRTGDGGHRPVRSVREIRRQVRFAQGRRSLRRDPGARHPGHRGQEGR